MSLKNSRVFSGSGSLAAMAVFEDRYKADMEVSSEVQNSGGSQPIFSFHYYFFYLYLIKVHIRSSTPPCLPLPGGRRQAARARRHRGGHLQRPGLRQQHRPLRHHQGQRRLPETARHGQPEGSQVKG